MGHTMTAAVTTTDRRTLTDGDGVATAPATSRRWGWAGILAGLGGIALFVLAGAMGDMPDSALADNERVLRQVADADVAVWLIGVISTFSAAALVVFGAGLRRLLAGQEPGTSLVPSVASSGVLLTAATLLVGGGISTELFWHLLQEVGRSDADTVAANLAIINTIPWVWAGLGLSAGAVAVAGIRRGSVPRWLAWTSAVLTALVVLTQLVPLQYLALVPGALWLIATGVAVLRRGDAA